MDLGLLADVLTRKTSQREREKRRPDVERAGGRAAATNGIPQRSDAFPVLFISIEIEKTVWRLDMAVHLKNERRRRRKNLEMDWK